MNDREQLRYNLLTRVRTFGIENAVCFPLSSKACNHFASLDVHIAIIDAANC